MGRVRIAPVTDPERYWEIMDVMVDAWGMKDYTEAVPAHFLRAIADNGGLVLAAYDGDRIVGFVLGILAMDERGKLYHYSHMLAVRREYRGKGVGLKLKLAQRDEAIKRGLDLVVWTYDPQQGLNARFNFSKLGVICRKFYPNYYGTMRDEINRGLVSDRFKVEWWVKSPRVVRRISGELPPPNLADVEKVAERVVETREVTAGIRAIESVKLDADSDVVLVEVPGDVGRVRDYSLELANEWRVRLRPVFRSFFSRGYIAVEFITTREKGYRRNFYVLWRAPLGRILAGDVPWS